MPLPTSSIGYLAMWQWQTILEKKTEMRTEPLMNRLRKRELYCFQRNNFVIYGAWSS
jgi:hypothetical protein